MKIPFNKVYQTGAEDAYVLEAIHSGLQCGNHQFCERVIALMKQRYGFQQVYLVPSGTAALEMGAVLAGIEPGDEVILPSYTFSSTVNSVVLFGAKPVFCEVDPKTLNIDVTKIEALITPKTKMIVPIDYAGLSCDIDAVMEIANRHNLIVMQDCAQSYGTRYKGRPAGTVPHLATFSFHETKNFSAGEGGALICNVPDWELRAHFLQEKGTDRRLVLNGMKNKYSWVDKGSSYLLSDVLAAMLLAQLEHEDEIRSKRGQVTAMYDKLFEPYFEKGVVDIMRPTKDDELNNHAYWAVFDTTENRQRFMDECRKSEIYVYIGYMPLHSAPYGLKFGYKPEDLPITESIGSRIARLPYYTGMADGCLEYVYTHMKEVLKNIYGF